VNYGLCAVTIPKSHRFGSVDSAWWERWYLFTDDRLTVQGLHSLNDEDFGYHLLGHRRASVGERQVVVYLHGYNTTFHEAAIRAAQIGFDLKIPDEMAFFSWPSRGTLDGYTADEASIEASEGAITDFLVRLAAESGADVVHVIAHSMGNRGLLRALQRIETNAERRSRLRFN
jgi:esterase/lipase superfamily enzyme